MKNKPEIDRLKWFLVLLIIASQIVRPFYDVPLLKGLYLMLYVMAVPGFAFVLGFNSRNITFKSWLKGLSALLIPLVIFQIIFLSLSYWKGGNEVIDTSGQNLISFLYKPLNVLWLFVSLIIWRLIFALFNKNTTPLVLLTISFALVGAFALLVFNQDILAIGKTVCFFPFFLLGAYSSEQTWKRAWKGDTSIYLLLILNAVFFIPDIYNYPDVEKIVDGNYGLTHLDGDLGINMLLRILFIIVSLANILVFLRLSKALGRLASEGDNVAIYLLCHVIFLQVILNVIPGLGVEISPVIIPFLYALIVGLCYLVTKIKIIQYLVYPNRLMGKESFDVVPYDAQARRRRRRRRY